MGVSSQGVSNISTDTNYTPAGARGAGISVSSPGSAIGTSAICNHSGPCRPHGGDRLNDLFISLAAQLL
ncbi:hypothetical protein XENTR_v10015566 [Xenopus tropicalis]|nr:hypothetical protein XENTR_v10015566 [Xenopus tropicalis]